MTAALTFAFSLPVLSAGAALPAVTPERSATVPQAPRLGRPVPADEAQAASLAVYPDGRGLPPGAGRAIEGRDLYTLHCAACHGDRGRGGSAEELAGGIEPLTSAYPDRTVGLYWPYATTLFDLIRRSKPMQAPGSLQNDEIYALTAYLLFENGLMAETTPLDANSLAALRMPNREGFIAIDATPPRPPEPRPKTKTPPARRR